MKPMTIFVILTLVAALVPMILFAQKQAANDKTVDIDIPYKKFVLDNGLTFIVHEDHKAPIVAVNVWYHVGSKNEKFGRTGFAHLFEHLMFNGSENNNDDYFQAMERIGATDLNGTTSEDRTNYFQNVPTSAVDVALWMESDRMGHLLGAIDQGKLDEQRGVVQNEKRQGENQPYALAEDLITNATWPAEHPYAHTVIGSMEDLNAASLHDVHEWFKTYYGAANATLVVAGDINADTALAKVQKYFGDIPSGPPVAHFNSWVVKRSGTQRQEAQDRVSQARIYKVWNIPQRGTPETTYLDLISDVLASGKTSRLYKRLVYDDQTATQVNSYLDDREIAGQFYIEVTAKQGEDLKKVEQAIDEELAKFLKSGPTEKELNRVKTQFKAGFIRGLERIGGFGGKSDILAMSQVFGGSPDAWKIKYQNVLSATAMDLQKAATHWLNDGAYILTINPFPQYSTTATDSALRKSLPKPETPPEATFPALQRTTLSNGLKIIFAERKSIPVVNFNLMFDAGYASDQFAAPGTAALAMNMIDEGTATRNALQISEELANLGANLSTGSNLDMSNLSMSALKSNLDASLALYADVLLHPSFPNEDFERLQKQTIAGIQREKTQPVQMGLRVLPNLLYGKNHAYSIPFTGSGTEESVAKMTREDMVKFYQTWIKPNHATLVIAGDITLAELQPKLEKLFSAWKPGDIPQKNIGTVQLPAKSSIYIMDKPGAQQSIIFPSNITLPKNNPDAIAIEAMNTILGGAFTSRINMNLREDKHWSYGSGSFVYEARGQQPFLAYGIVQTDKTKESMMELNKEFRDILSTRPATADELEKVQANMTLELPGSWETNASVAGSIIEMVRFGYSDDYFSTYVKKIKSLSLNDIARAAKEVVYPDHVTWLVVGDRAKIEAGIRELGFGEVHLIDTDGNVIQ
ncbi:MAG TPA: pitrilysin family protein [Bacteroidota bacterium]|nr:pitrilysin family protein [Bacteroidota bacterium]